MKLRQLLPLAAVSLCLSLLPFVDAAAQGTDGIDAWLTMLEDTEIKTLSDKDMETFLAAMNELEDLDDATLDTDSPTIYDAMSASPKARAVLSKYDYSVPAFQGTMNNVMLAMGALAMEGQRAEIEQAVAQIEAMKGQLPEAQYEMMRKQVMGALALFDRAPEANIRMVEKYQDQIEQLGE